MLGKETIDTNTYGKSQGRNGSYSTNFQNTGRELMTADEVRLLDNRYSILFIRGERPVIDLKYDLKKHPDIDLTADGKGEPYRHGNTNLSSGSISLFSTNLNVVPDEEYEPTTYELLSDEDLEEKYI